MPLALQICGHIAYMHLRTAVFIHSRYDICNFHTLHDGIRQGKNKHERQWFFEHVYKGL